jgi:hypothetical protein
LQVRRRHPPFALLLRVCALVASLTMAGREAGAQGAGSAADPLLMRPVLDGDPQDPPVARRDHGFARRNTAAFVHFLPPCCCIFTD